MMNSSTASGLSSENLGEHFPSLARCAFSFLSDLGFLEVESKSSYVLLRKGEVDVDIYHGRRSYEIDAGVSARGDRFSISEIVAAVDPTAAEHYTVRSARTLNDARVALIEIGSLLRRYGDRALSDDPKFFLLLAEQRLRWAKDFELDVLARQLRPRAEDAFRRGEYAVAAELYGRIGSRLSPLEEKKRSIAELRSKRD